MGEKTQPIGKTPEWEKPEWQKQQVILTGIAYALADTICKQINQRALKVKGPIRYSAQFTLEKLIQILQERV